MHAALGAASIPACQEQGQLASSKLSTRVTEFLSVCDLQALFRMCFRRHKAPYDNSYPRHPAGAAAGRDYSGP
jgi:hypothetical protein